MANTKSAIKALRVTGRKTIINLRVKRNYKTARKDVMDAIKAGDKKKAQDLLTVAYKAIDKAAKTNVIHANTAARYKSSMATKIAKL